MSAYTEKEPKGMKTHIKMQCTKITPKSPFAVMQFPKYLHHKLYKFSFRSKQKVWLEVKDIDTRDKLAFVVKRHYGFGTFLVTFWDRWKRNKYFNHRFKCRGDNCPARKRGKCNYRFYNARERIRGWSCPMNRRYASNWSARAKITIYPKDNPDYQLGYGYTWHKDYDLMHRFSRWFWRGKQ